MILVNVLSLVFQIIEINKLMSMHKEAVMEVQHEQEQIIEKEVYSKIGRDIMSTLEKSLKIKNDSEAKERLTNVINKITNLNMANMKSFKSQATGSNGSPKTNRDPV